jgi:hypothetical protein
MKLKEKSREVISLREKVLDLETKNLDLVEQVKSYKTLTKTLAYNEKRSLLMTQTILNQRELLRKYTRAMK